MAPDTSRVVRPITVSLVSLPNTASPVIAKLCAPPITVPFVIIDAPLSVVSAPKVTLSAKVCVPVVVIAPPLMAVIPPTAVVRLASFSPAVLLPTA